MPIPNIDDKLLSIIGTTIRDRVKKRIREGKISPKTVKSNSTKTSGTTLIESKRLLGSINFHISGNKAQVGTNLVYARIHHEGGTIVPKKAKFLAIPLTTAAKAMRPRDFEDTFISKGVIFRKLDDGKIEAIYALKKKVIIPERKYLYTDHDDIEILRGRIKTWWEAKMRSI